MGLFKVIIYICVALFITNIVTQNDKKLIKKIPVIGEIVANIKNLNLYIIILCLIIMIFFI
jgi:Na+/H+ antiporter NhaC